MEKAKQSPEEKNTQPLFIPLPNFGIEYHASKEKTLNSAAELAALYTKVPMKEVIIGMHNNGKMMPKSERTYQIHTINSLPDLVKTLKVN